MALFWSYGVIIELVCMVIGEVYLVNLLVSPLGEVNLPDINLYILQALVKFMLPNGRTNRVALKMPSPHPSTLYIYQERYVAVSVH